MSGRHLSNVFFGRFKQTAVETPYLNLEKSRFPLRLKLQIFRQKEPKVAKQPHHYHQHHHHHHHHYHSYYLVEGVFSSFNTIEELLKAMQFHP